MAGNFLFQDAKFLKVLLLFFCTGGCISGVVNRSFKQQNDILRLTMEESNEESVESETSDDEPISSEEIPESPTHFEVFSSVESNDSSGDLLNSNNTNNASEVNLKNFRPMDNLNFTENELKESEVLNNRQSGDFDQEKDGMMLNGDDSIFIPISNETISAIIHTDFPNNTDDKTLQFNVTNLGFNGENGSFTEASNETHGLLQSDWPLRDFNESETGIQDFRIQFNESDSNTSLSSNDTEGESVMDFKMDVNDTIEEASSGFNFNIDNKLSNISSENQSSVNASEGIFSNFGFEFLRNSEVAKNAALAMEVFNFSDSSITDHILEDGEFHGFLDQAVLTVGGENSTSFQAIEFNSTNENSNGSVRVEEFGISPGSNVSLLENGTLSSTTDSILNQTQFGNETLKFNFTDRLGEVNETFVSNNSITENGTLKFNFTDRIEEVNETFVSDISITENGSNSTEDDLIESDNKNATINIPQCPPPGLCLLWFMSQDTCAVDSHCLGSRICCRIRCSKTCIDV